MRMAEYRELDAYKAKLDVLQFPDYKHNPGAIKSLFNQFIEFREATDEELLLFHAPNRCSR